MSKLTVVATVTAVKESVDTVKNELMKLIEPKFLMSPSFVNWIRNPEWY